MRRYFMLIPEAVSLVLHAAALAKGSDVFVLEMGEQVRRARPGAQPDPAVGLRARRGHPHRLHRPAPRREASEELVGEDEEIEPSSVDGILRIRPRAPLERAPLISKILELEGRAETGDRAAVIGLLQAIVATYHPRRG